MEELGVSPVMVEQRAKQLGQPFGKNNIYRLLRKDGPDNLNRATLTALLETLHSFRRGRHKIKISDLIEYQEDSNGEDEKAEN